MRRTIARGGRGRAHLGGSLATAADLAAHRRAAGRHRLAARPAVADRSREPARDPGRVRGERRRCGTRWRRRTRRAAGGRGGAGGVLRRRARARRARGPAALPARRAGGGAARCRARTQRWPPNASGCAAPSGSSRRPRAARRRCTRATAPSASGSPAVLRELEPLAALDPALAPAGRAAARRRRPPSRTSRAISAATRAASAPIRRAWRRSRSGCSCCRGSAANTAAPSPISPRGARRSPPSWPRSARYEEGAGRAPGRGRRRRTRAPPRRPPRCPRRASRRRRSLEKKVDATLRELGLRDARGCRSALEARELGADGRRPGALPVRAQPGRGAAPAGARSRRAASCRG